MNRLLFPVALTFSVLSAVFAQSAGRLFTARFARLHEFIRLCIPKSATLKKWPVILIGIAPFNRVFCVRPTKTQRELANIIILGKTRVGKGLKKERPDKAGIGAAHDTHAWGGDRERGR